MRTGLRAIFVTILITALAALAAAQIGNDYQPKFPGDPARTENEAIAMGYMRVVVNAQKDYSRKHGGNYAGSLSALVGNGSFTRRMLGRQRGDYKPEFKGGTKEYSLWMTPTVISPTERAFFVDQSGIIRAEEDKRANADSPKAER